MSQLHGDHEWRPPREFEEYEIVRQLGHGAMGHVYLARDRLLDRLVAIKFIARLRPDSSARERFAREARAIARLQHPNVVSVYRVGTWCAIRLRRAPDACQGDRGQDSGCPADPSRHSIQPCFHIADGYYIYGSQLSRQRRERVAAMVAATTPGAPTPRGPSA